MSFQLIDAGGFVGSFLFKENSQALVGVAWALFVVKYFFLGGFGAN